MAGKDSSLSSLFELNVSKSDLRVKNRESERREFKLEFDNKNLPKFAKALAAFANRDGGVLFFGIKDKPRELVGIDEGAIPDDVVFTNFLKEYFQPEILFQSRTLTIHGKKIHALLVTPSVRKPVICRKAKSLKKGQGQPEEVILREGAIYYRYSASSDEIKYAELRHILDVERESFFRSMVDNITLLNKVGIDKAAVVNAEELSGNDQSASLYVTNETAKNLNWIDSGRFVEDENEGAKAYYVMRKVEVKHGVEIPKPTDYAKTHPITKTDLTKLVKISGSDFDAVAWKLGITDNAKYHVPGSHGKNKWHKYTQTAKELILREFPLDMLNRRASIKAIAEEFKAALRK